MKPLLISSAFYILYLTFDAWQDSWYIKKYGRIYHGFNWVLKAFTALGIGYANFGDWLKTGAYCLLLVAITWIYFDFILYAFMKKNPVTYIGSGGWDEWFKFKFGNDGKNDARAVKAIWITKLILLSFALSIYYGITI